MEIRKGFLRSYDPANHQADVQLAGSMATLVKAVPVAHHLGAELLTAGAQCAVIFFEGDPGVVVCTWDGAPPAWVTTTLIKEATVKEEDLAFDVASQVELDARTPSAAYVSGTGDQNLTTSWATYSPGGTDLSYQVTVPGGKTYNVFLVAHVSIQCSGYSNPVDVELAIYEGSTQRSYARGTHNEIWEQDELSVEYAGSVSATCTFYVRVKKNPDLNTERARVGTLALIYWEAA